MTSSNGNIFRVTGPLWGEFTSDRWIPLTKASDTELWYFIWSAHEQTDEQTTEKLVIWDAIALIMMSPLWIYYLDCGKYNGNIKKYLFILKLLWISWSKTRWVDSLAFGRCGCEFKYVFNFNNILLIDILNISWFLRNCPHTHATGPHRW